MQPVTPTRPRDPAPSRLRYRMQRWMLTPGIRLGLRIGVPFCLTLAAAGAYLADADRREAVTRFAVELRDSIQERPEFMVALMAIDGAGLNLATDIRETVPLDFPVSSFDLDLEDIRHRIAKLDPVRSVSVRIRPGGVLQIDVAERQPVAVWRRRDGLGLVDGTGTHIDDLVSRTLRPDLPLVAGTGADTAISEALALFATAGPLDNRLRGLVRIGERRWDVVLDRGQRIQLPSDNPVQALERVIVLNQGSELLERDVAVIDMRLSARPTIRMSESAVKDWWRIRQINGVGQ